MQYFLKVIRYRYRLIVAIVIGATIAITAYALSRHYNVQNGPERLTNDIIPSDPAATAANAASSREYGDPRPLRANPLILTPSTVIVERRGTHTYRYTVNGRPQLIIGMGYNPIYRHLSPEERAANYERDFRILCEAGVNTITGWDADKGYEQDKFDELTLDYAQKYNIGVVMPFYLPPDGDYTDLAFRQSLREEAITKIERFKNHPALRMWGVGNEVLTEIRSPRMRAAFGQFYIRLADLFHRLDPNHPVIYREAEDLFIPAIKNLLERNPGERPWLLYGMNVYTPEIERILDEWPSYDFGRPVLVSEFGAEPDLPGGRAMGYVDMWRNIRSYPDYVIGGAPYVWTVEGPEPTDTKWGLTDADAVPVDETFDMLAAEWRKEYRRPRRCG